MIYKFIAEDDSELEVFSGNKNDVLICVANTEQSIISLNKEQVYNLIGALHSLKSKM